MKKQINENSKILADEWFSRAMDDEISAKDILKDKEGAASTVCFLSQQMAEKYLKGYLVFNNKRFPKIHALDRLVKLSESIELQFKEIKEEAGYLTAFYVTTRYPGDYPEFNFKDAEQAFKKALKIKKFVLNKLK